jgi:hypothetical protein
MLLVDGVVVASGGDIVKALYAHPRIKVVIGVRLIEFKTMNMSWKTT